MRTKSSLLLMFFLLVIAGSIIAFFFFTKTLDKKYSSLIERQLIVSNNVQAITKRAHMNFYSLVKLLQVDSLKNMESEIEFRNQNVLANNKSLDSLVLLVADSVSEGKQLMELINKRKVYLQACDSFFVVKQDQKNSIALSYFNTYLTPCFFEYQVALDSFFKINNNSLLLSNRNITEEYQSKSLVYLAFGLSPFVLTLLYTLFLIGVVFLISKKVGN